MFSTYVHKSVGEQTKPSQSQAKQSTAGEFFSVGEQEHIRCDANQGWFQYLRRRCREPSLTGGTCVRGALSFPRFADTRTSRADGRVNQICGPTPPAHLAWDILCLFASASRKWGVRSVFVLREGIRILCIILM
jgi:hypothetical protein